MEFTPDLLHQLHLPAPDSTKTQNGQITLIGGSDLFPGAILLALKTASRFADMIFFSSPEPWMGELAAQIKSQLHGFIWFPWEDTEIAAYITKSDAILIGPGMKRYRKESTLPPVGAIHELPLRDPDGAQTKHVTEQLLKQFPHKQWIIDGGSLQVLNPALIPHRAILTPNHKEYTNLFPDFPYPADDASPIASAAARHHCIITHKGPTSIVTDGHTTYTAGNGNPGLTKGGTGDTLAGLTAALAAQNPPLLAAAAAAWLIKAAADDLFKTAGPHYNADDLANQIPQTFHKYVT